MPLSAPRPALGVLVGGASRRFPGGKLRALVDGEPMLDRVLRQVAPAGAPRYLLGGPPDPRAVSLSWHPLADRRPHSGPLAGIAALTETTPVGVVVVAGDQPLVDAALLGSLWEASAGHPAACFVLEDELQPLPLALRPEGYPQLEALLRSPETPGPGRLLRAVRARRVRAEEVGREPRDLRMALSDVDTPEALADLNRFLRY